MVAPSRRSDDELGERLRRDVLDVAVPVEQLLDPTRVDVDEDDLAARLREHLGERQADVAGADDRDVVRLRRTRFAGSAVVVSGVVTARQCYPPAVVHPTRHTRRPGGDQIASSALAMRAAACPSPYRGGAPGGHAAARTAATIRVGVVVDEHVGPVLDGVAHSVDGRIVTHGTRYQYASFCSPPESVAITRACDAAEANAR